jgi:hypothetical protein
MPPKVLKKRAANEVEKPKEAKSVSSSLADTNTEKKRDAKA